jgi:hypothetical protein
MDPRDPAPSTPPIAHAHTHRIARRPQQLYLYAIDRDGIGGGTIRPAIDCLSSENYDV